VPFPASRALRANLSPSVHRLPTQPAFDYRNTAEKERRFEAGAGLDPTGVRLPEYSGKRTPVRGPPPRSGDEPLRRPDPADRPFPAEEHDRVEQRQPGVGALDGGVDGGKPFAGLDLQLLEDGPEVDALHRPLARREVVGQGGQDLADPLRGPQPFER